MSPMSLQRSYLFQEMSPEFLERLSPHLTHESHAAGDTLFREGDPAEFLYVLEEGSIRLSVGDAGQVTHLLNKPGEAVGWSSLGERETYTASARCLESVTVIKVHRDTLLSLFREDPASGLAFYRRLAAVIGRRLMDSYRMLLIAHGEKGPPSYG